MFDDSLAKRSTTGIGANYSN